MATALDVIMRALNRAHVIADGEPAAAEQVAAGLKSLNEMLEAWLDEGIPTGLRGLELDTALAIDDGALRAITDNLAVELGDNAGLPVSPVLATRAERGRASLVGRYMGTTPVRFDPLLTGSGRYDIENG